MTKLDSIIEEFEQRRDLSMFDKISEKAFLIKACKEYAESEIAQAKLEVIESVPCEERDIEMSQRCWCLGCGEYAGETFCMGEQENYGFNDHVKEVNQWKDQQYQKLNSEGLGEDVSYDPAEFMKITKNIKYNQLIGEWVCIECNKIDPKCKCNQKLS